VTDRIFTVKNPFANIKSLVSLAHLTSLVQGKPVDALNRGVPARARRATVAAPAQPTRDAPASPGLPSIAPAPRSPFEEDPDEEMHGGTPVAEARRRERARCAAIVMSSAGLKHPRVAYALAFQTSLSVAEAVATLEGMQAGDWAHLTAGRTAAGASRHRSPSTH